MRHHLNTLLAVGVLLAGCAPSVVAPAGPTGSAAPTAAPTAAPSAAPTAASAVGLALAGKVYDDDLQPVEADVVAQTGDQPPVTARSGPDGSYRLALPAPGSYRVTASKAGWTSRTQTIELSGDAALDFGGISTAGSNPFFLSNTPEIARVEAVEASPAGPLKLNFHFSEPIVPAGQERFVKRIYITGEDGKPLLYGNGATDSIFKTDATWDAEGRVFTLSYNEPYLASGAKSTVYTARIEQAQTSDIDPVTRERKWDPLGVQDADGNELGRNRADFAFLSPQLFPISLTQLANEDFGKTHPMRRWVLTHQSSFSWAAKKDDVPPGLELVRAQISRRLGPTQDDVLELRFNEPMRVVRSQSEPNFTMLKKELQLAYVNVSDSADGSNPKALDVPVSDITFSRNEPNVVYLHYAVNTFDKRQWVEVVLGPDMKDPAGNGPDPAKSRLTGPVN